jgi:hypothetical protein
MPRCGLAAAARRTGFCLRIAQRIEKAPDAAASLRSDK